MVRFASPADLEFAGQDGYLPRSLLKRKIEGGEVILAEREGEAVGYARLEYLWSTVPYLALIFVFPEQRRGVGRAILRFSESSVRDQGQEALYSSSQGDEAEPQAWHRPMGFEECGFTAGINPDGLFFRLRLR